MRVSCDNNWATGLSSASLCAQVRRRERAGVGYVNTLGHQLPPVATSSPPSPPLRSINLSPYLHCYNRFLSLRRISILLSHSPFVRSSLVSHPFRYFSPSIFVSPLTPFFLYTSFLYLFTLHYFSHLYFSLTTLSSLYCTLLSFQPCSSSLLLLHYICRPRVAAGLPPFSKSRSRCIATSFLPLPLTFSLHSPRYGIACTLRLPCKGLRTLVPSPTIHRRARPEILANASFSIHQLLWLCNGNHVYCLRSQI